MAWRPFSASELAIGCASGVLIWTVYPLSVVARPSAACVSLLSGIKMFLKPVWEGKMHGVTNIGVFRPLFCVGMLGKSTNYSTGTRPLCSTF